MSESIGFVFTGDESELLASMRRIEAGLTGIRADLDKVNANGTKSFNGLANAADNSERRIRLATKSAATMGAVFGTVVAQGVSLAMQKLAGLGDAVVGGAARYEQLNIAFTTFLGSAEKAEAVLGQLTDFAAKTPFSQEEIFGAGKQLLALGVGTEEIIDTMRRLGDISAGTSKPLGELSTIYGKILSQGRAQGDELLQLAEAGIPIYDQLAKTLGKSTAEIFKMQEKGQLTFKIIQDALFDLTKEGGRFNGLLEAQSKSLSGLASTAKDNFMLAARAIGEGLGPRLKEITKSVIDFTNGFDVEKLKAFGAAIGDAIGFVVKYGKEIVIAGTAYLAYTNFVKIATAVTKAFNSVTKTTPWGLIASIATVAVVKIVEWTTATAELTKASREVARAFIEEKREADKLFAIAESSTATLQQRKEAISALKDLYPEYLKGIDAEASSLAEVKAAHEGVNRAILEGIVSRLRAQKQEEIATKIFEAQARINALRSGRDNISFGEILSNLAKFDFSRTDEEVVIGTLNDRVKELGKNLRTTAEIYRAENFTDLLNELSGTPGRSGGSAQSQLDRLSAQDKAFKASLKGRTVAQLEALKVDEKTTERQKILINEVIAVRKKEEATAAAARAEREKAAEAEKKRVEAAIKAFEQLREKLAQDSDQAELDKLDPEDRINREAKIAQDTITKFAEELRAAAKSAGKTLSADDQASIAVLYTAAERERLEKLDKLYKDQADSAKDAVSKDIKQKLDAIDLQTETRKADYELQVSAFEKTKELEEQKQRVLLHLEIQGLEAKRQILQAKGQLNTAEAKQIENAIKVAQAQLNAIGKDSDPEKASSGLLQGWIKNAFKVSDAEAKEILDSTEQLVGSIASTMSTLTDIQIQENDRYLSALRERIDEEQALLEKELERQRNGDANYATEKLAVINDLKQKEAKAEADAVVLRKKALRQQILIDGASQASNIALAVSAIIAWESKTKGVVGIMTAAAGLAGIIALVAKARAQAKAAADQALFKGGPVSQFLNGPTDRHGQKGLRIEGSNVRVGGDEYVVNGTSTQRNRAFLDDMNSGKFDSIDLREKFASLHSMQTMRMNPTAGYYRERAKEIEAKRKANAGKEAKTARGITREEMRAALADHSKATEASMRKVMLDEYGHKFTDAHGNEVHSTRRRTRRVKRTG